MRTLFKLVLLLVVGLVAYNYYYGSPRERAQSRRIVNQARELGSDTWELLRGEQEKLQSGKYDDALERLDDLYGDLRERVDRIGDRTLEERLSELGRRRRDVERELPAEDTLTRRARRELDALTDETEALMHEMEAKSKPGAPY